MSSENQNEMPVMPNLRPDAHKEQLKAELMAAYGIRRRVLPAWARAAAMVVAGAMLMGAGAVAKDAYDQYRGTSVETEKRVVHLDADGKPTEPDKAKVTLSSGMAFPAKNEAEAQNQQKALADAIAAKRFKLIREMEGPTGEHQYIYELTLADGATTAMNSPVRLEGVDSWEQWQQKQQEWQVQRYQQVLQAVKDGKARITSDDIILTHVCRDAGSEKKIEVMKIRLADGKTMAVIHDAPLGSTNMSQKTSWQEHLDALASGKRELLETKAISTFTYEYPGPDGKMQKFAGSGLVGAKGK